MEDVLESALENVYFKQHETPKAEMTLEFL